MADNKGDDPKANENKPGAVRPPVLDLKARPAGGEPTRPEVAKVDAGSAGASKPGGPAMPGSGSGSSDRPKPADVPKPAEPAKPADRPRSAAAAAPPAAGFGFGAALVGGLLGLGAAYGLAYAGLWPAPPAAPVVADQRLASFSKSIPELVTVTQTTQAELATLNQRVATLEKAPATPAGNAGSADMTAISDKLAALGSRVETLAAAPASAADGASVEALRNDLVALGNRIDALAARVGIAEAGLQSLDTTVTQTVATLASQPSDIGAVLQLPLILSGFETAFATGRPYETELAALRAADPKAAIPTGIANQAPTGLTRPDVIARRFDEVLPAILAGRPSDPDAQWQKGALDWFASAIALRPTGEIEGDTPEAVTSRLIGAVDRRDFATAQTLLDSLPAPMQAAADDVPAMIAEQAEAETFLQQLRDAALSGEVAK